LVGVLCSLESAIAHGQAAPAPDAAPPSSSTEPQPQPPAQPSIEELDRRLRELEDRLGESERRRAEAEQQAKEERRRLEERVERVEPVLGRITGYVDVGFFKVAGNGSGIRADIGHEHLPEYAAVPDSWTFLGDPLATAVNARGEPADTGGSRAITFNPIHAGSAPSFIVNSLTLNLFAAVGDDLTANAAVDFVPRSRNVSDPMGTSLGDFIDVKLAYLEYIVPLTRMDLSLYAGKIDSVLGIEYRSQDAPDRISVTPSLICRYTCGRPLGLKARARFFDGALVAAAALTNGSHMVEMFPFYDEIDVNQSKTVAGRLSYRFALGSGLELGASGAYGAQDNQPSDGVHQYHYGADLHLGFRDLDVAAEWVHGRALGQSDPGEAPCGVAPCLNYRGAYGQIAYRAFNWLTPYFRADWRRALHESGASFLYFSDAVRFTGGARLEIGTAVILKAEYTRVMEIGRVPDFPDDVITSALVIKY
jgi:hypothetical protein